MKRQVCEIMKLRKKLVKSGTYWKGKLSDKEIHKLMLKGYRVEYIAKEDKTRIYGIYEEFYE